MEIPGTLLEVLKKDGVVAIATLGPDGRQPSHLQETREGRYSSHRGTASLWSKVSICQLNKPCQPNDDHQVVD